MTWKDFSIIVMGKEKKELNEWARTRNLAYIIYLSSTTEKAPKSLKAFWHIPAIDDVDIEIEDNPKLTDEQLARTLKLYGVN
jgi:pyrrolidone-carboxylate peptidase